MKNLITAKVEFSFKGEVFSPSTILDLDQMVRQCEELPSTYRVIAVDNQIDTYSYLYEVMEQSPIVFFQAQGLASEFLRDGVFDFLSFKESWNEARLDQMCLEIAATEIGVESLEQLPGLKNALIKVYELGKKEAGQE